eukprot:CAMPEP_0202450842 /NCGR_PEP_ID=MMETSP1360-20130828/9390_1 /ASSEMBLY_ACC=CAM_ASM_000848 /TAXON_ID=515479 /ORGANISM="Licmophora paradoxa, Strain CCMP2313" /LENGTH=65 /DNA_ID=CAMNT_0049069251 /DNA_START=631 /DNA_END=828 /DNA_ORIENTATION=-
MEEHETLCTDTGHHKIFGQQVGEFQMGRGDRIGIHLGHELWEDIVYEGKKFDPMECELVHVSAGC